MPSLASWLRFLKLLVTPFILLLLAGFQTSFWFDLFGWFSAPPLWLILIVYVSLYRRSNSTILWVYLLGFIAASFTAAPLKMIWTCLLALHFLIQFVKSRVFWGGPGYFVLVATASTAVFEILYMILSRAIEANPTSILPIERLTHVLLTPIFSYLIFQLMVRIEPIEPELSSDERGAA